MTAPDLAAIKARAEAATQGPWKVWGMEVLADPVGDSNLDTALPIARTTDPHRGLHTWNADFIAAARVDVPALVAYVERCEAETARVRAAVERVEAIRLRQSRDIERVAAERDSARAERDALRAAVAKIDAWARGNYGGAKSPAEVWPGLDAILRAALIPDAET